MGIEQEVLNSGGKWFEGIWYYYKQIRNLVITNLAQKVIKTQN